MPTKTFNETVTRCVDVCDFCENVCGIGSNRCDICGRIACYNHAARDGEQLLNFEQSWICTECNTLGIVCKQTIRRLKAQIVNERKAWRKLCKERANDGHRGNAPHVQ
jgi:hypothetical protein